MASGADPILAATRLYDRTEDAIADLNRVFAATARRRDMAKPVLTPRRAAAELRAAAAAGERVGVLFGAERAGLDNDDVVLADAVIQVPTNPAFTSINLAQAVLLIGYEWFLVGDRTPEIDLALGGARLATKQELVDLFEHLEAELDAGGYFRRVETKRPAMIRNLRNIFQRTRMLEQDVRTLRGVIRALTGRRARQDRDQG